MFHKGFRLYHLSSVHQKNDQHLDLGTCEPGTMFQFFFLARTNAHRHWLVGMIPFLTAMACLAPTAVTLPESDSKSLLKFKASILLNVDKLQNWNASQPPCNGNHPLWTGLRCENGSVTVLQLEGLGLGGRMDVDALAGIPTLRSISLMNNSFSGGMPNLGKLGSQLRGIFLSNNLFSGDIHPDQFTGMVSLKKIWLSGNKFSGPIPTTLAAIPRLLELRLEHNQLTGRIPDFALFNLTMFNVSYNELEGEIPASLRHVNANSFEGNKALCGPPLQNSCAVPTKRSSPILVFVETGLSLMALFAVVVAVTMIVNRDRTARFVNNPSYSIKKGKGSSFQKVGFVTEGDQNRRKSIVNRQASNLSEEGSEPNDLVFVVDDGQRFEMQDLLRAKADVLGTGSFGSSYRAVLVDGTPMVIKRCMEMNNLPRETFHEYLKRLGRLRHPNISPILAYFYKKDEKLMVSEYARNGSLVHRLHGNRHQSTPVAPPLDRPTRLKIVKGVARGLSHLYTELPHLVIPHGQLKSSNVLLNEDDEPLLADYALAPVVNVHHAAQLMVSYRSPECLAGSAPTRKSDVWSLGVLILEILTSKIPVSHYPDAQGGIDLPGWVNSMLREEWTGEVFDTDMGEFTAGDNEVLKLLQIGLICCEEDLDNRWEMKEVIDRIEEIEEGGGGFMREQNDDSSSNEGEEIHANTPMEDGRHDPDG